MSLRGHENKTLEWTEELNAIISLQSLRFPPYLIKDLNGFHSIDVGAVRLCWGKSFRFSDGLIFIPNNRHVQSLVLGTIMYPGKTCI